jgi:type III secretion system low calcium response chaperone LcrH/SycD
MDRTSEQSAFAGAAGAPFDPARAIELLVPAILEGATWGALIDVPQERLEAVYALAYGLYEQGRYDEALQGFNFLVMHNHYECRYLIGYAACQQLLKRPVEALKYYGIASMLDLTDPVPVFHAAQCRLALQQTAEAVEALEFALVLAQHRPGMSAMAARIDGLLALLNGRENENG